ncbi:MAG: hypothetical protein ACKPE3_02710 [Sphaerospermopsis kisseleviana]
MLDNWFQPLLQDSLLIKRSATHTEFQSNWFQPLLQDSLLIKIDFLTITRQSVIVSAPLARFSSDQGNQFRRFEERYRCNVSAPLARFSFDQARISSSSLPVSAPLARFSSDQGLGDLRSAIGATFQPLLQDSLLIKFEAVKDLRCFSPSCKILF